MKSEVRAQSKDRKSTRLNPVTHDHLVCRLLLLSWKLKGRMTRNFMNWSCKLTLTERARWWWGIAPSEIRGESTKQYSRQTLVFFGGRCSRISRWTPEARSRICVCQASFLMTFVQSGMPPRLPAHDQCMLSHDISACSAT